METYYIRFKIDNSNFAGISDSQDVFFERVVEIFKNDEYLEYNILHAMELPTDDIRKTVGYEGTELWNPEFEGDVFIDLYSLFKSKEFPSSETIITQAKEMLYKANLKSYGVYRNGNLYIGYEYDPELDPNNPAFHERPDYTVATWDEITQSYKDISESD